VTKRYRPEDDHPVGYWAFMRRPGVPNAPENGRRAATEYLFGWAFIVIGIPALIGLVVWIVS
jgi:hypothetical protein